LIFAFANKRSFKKGEDALFNDLVVKNRSFRGYDGQYKVSSEQLMEMLKCARLTASSMNLQTLKYYIGADEAPVKEVLGEVKFAGGLLQLNLPYEGQMPTAFILICHDLLLNGNPDTFKIDVGISAQTMLLKATEMGLGGCMMSTFNSDKVKQQLNLADNLVPMLIVSIGKPIERVEIKDIENGESHKYFRDEDGVHYVPKRKLTDIII
jgi:nitroreductase